MKNQFSGFRPGLVVLQVILHLSLIILDRIIKCGDSLLYNFFISPDNRTHFSSLFFFFRSTPDGHLVMCHFPFSHGCGCCVKIDNLPMASWSCVDKCISVQRERKVCSFKVTLIR